MFVLTEPSAQKPRCVGLRAEGLRQRRHLDRIAERRAGAVRFDVADGVGIDAGQRLRQRDHLGLAVHAGRGEADLRASRRC